MRGVLADLLVVVLLMVGCLLTAFGIAGLVTGIGI